MPASRYLRQPEVRLDELVRGGLSLELSVDDPLDVQSLESAVKYEGYLRQEASRAQRARRDEGRAIPEDFPFARVPGLSHEVIQRLNEVRPQTLGQASRLPGVTAAAVTVLGAYLGRLAPDEARA
jgi:tRNA uridine 5-carboxymethylaminomethyl modification enzyme